MNMVEATLERRNGGLVANLGSQAIGLDEETLSQRPGLKEFEGKEVVLGVRPEDLEDLSLASGTPQDHRLHGTVQLTEALGSEIMVHFTVDARHAVTEEVRELAEDTGDDRVPTHGDAHATLVGRFGARSRVRKGDDITVAVDTRALHFFDPHTGLGIYDGGSTKGAS
jgi:multiple sugar transport system ATP-binding protein